LYKWKIIIYFSSPDQQQISNIRRPHFTIITKPRGILQTRQMISPNPSVLVLLNYFVAFNDICERIGHKLFFFSCEHHMKQIIARHKNDLHSISWVALIAFLYTKISIRMVNLWFYFQISCDFRNKRRAPLYFFHRCRKRRLRYK
jgi:hypothetical protein